MSTLGQVKRLIVAMLLSVVATAAQAEKRVALVIGNSDYQNTGKLPNPQNDSADVGEVLEKLGFQVFKASDLDKRGMDRMIATFARAATEADAALFFYAGHGMQFQGQNYLMPIDAKLEDEVSLTFEMTRVDDVLSAISRARGVKLLILDACRDNPLAQRLQTKATNRSVGPTRGFSRIERTQGTLIAYATQANDVAIDGTGRNSPFTTALLKEIETPNLEVGALFRRVTAEVNRATGGKQTPELSVSILGEFYFRKTDTDLQVWSRLRDSGSRADFADFLTRFPTSPLADAARAKIAALDRSDVDRLTREQIERARLAQEQAERERLARQKAEQDRLAVEEARRLQFAREQADRERLARLRAEQEQAERERLARIKAEQERIAAEDARRQQAAREAAERLRLEQEQARAALAREIAEQQRIAREASERARLEHERVMKELADREARMRADLARLAAPPPPPPSEPVISLPGPIGAISPLRPLISSIVGGGAAPPPAATPATPPQAALQPVAPPPPAAPANLTPSTLTREDLVRSVKAELKRIGCFTGPVDAVWPNSAATRALADYHKHAEKPAVDLSEQLLGSLRAHAARVCPIVAVAPAPSLRPARPAVTPPAAKPRPVARPRPAAPPTREVARPKPAAKPAGGGGRCFNFNGQRFCE